MKLLHRSGICALALVAGSATLMVEPVILRDLAFDGGSQNLSVGSIRAGLWSVALAQTPDTLALENVKFSFGSAAFEVKRIELSGVTSSRADVEALFSSASSEPMANRVVRIGAKQVSIPEVKVTQKLGAQTETLIYRNVVLSDIAQGRIGSATVEATGVEATGAKGSTVFSYGKTAISELDLAAFAKLYETRADAPSQALTRIHGPFSIDGIDVTDNAEGVNLRIARVSGRDFLARPTKEGWAGTIAILAEAGDKDEHSAQEQARLIPAVADFLGAFDVGLVEATGIEMKAVEKVKTGSKSQPNSFVARIGRIAYSGASNSQPADVRLEGLEFGGSDARFKLDLASLTGFSFRQTLEGLQNLQGKSLDDLDVATGRTLIPTLGSLRLSGFDLDAPGDAKKGQRPDRMKITVKDMEITADKPVNGIPTNIRFEQKNASFAVSPSTKDDFLKELAALGYKSIDQSFVIAAQWNEAANEITLKEVSIQGQDMFGLTLSGLIGNVTKDLYSPDQATAAAALIGAKAKSADLVIEDRGLFGRYLAKAAKEQKTTPDALRRTFSSAAPVVIGSMLGNSEQSQALGQAVARFIAQPGKLIINAQPKSASGFGVMDAMLAADPKAALEKLTISAKVE